MGSCLCLLSVFATVATLHNFLKRCSPALNISKLSTSVGQKSPRAAILMSAKTTHSAEGPLLSSLADGRAQFFVVGALESLLSRSHQLRLF